MARKAKISADQGNSGANLGLEIKRTALENEEHSDPGTFEDYLPENAFLMSRGARV